MAGKVREKTNLMVWDVPVAVKAKFKAACAKKKYTMKAVLTTFMKNYV